MSFQKRSPVRSITIATKTCRWIVPLAVLLAIVPATAFGQLILLVDRTDDLGFIASCIDDVPNDCTLRGAINLANFQPPGTEVIVELEAATYELMIDGPDEDGNVTGDLDILRDMTLHGQGATVSVISGGEAAPLDDRLVEVHGPDNMVVFESLAFAHAVPPNGLHAVFIASTNTAIFHDCGFISNGSIATGGGGLRLGYGSLAQVQDCEFSFNSASTDGAAISSGAEFLSVITSTFADNYAVGNGGVFSLEPPIAGDIGTTIVLQSLFERNHAYRGGVVWASQETNLVLQESTLRDNDAMTVGPGDGSGGAIYSGGHLEINLSTLSSNEAEDGGSAITSVFMASPQPIVDVFNSTFSANTGVAYDLASVHLENVAAEFLHVTFAEQPLDISTSQADLALQNSLLAGGCALILGTFQTNGGNLAVDDSCWGLTPGLGDQVVADFGLSPLGPNGGPTPTHLPSVDSVVLGAAAVCPPEDQRSLQRPAMDCASGSVERQTNEAAIFDDGFESGDVLQWSSSTG